MGGGGQEAVVAQPEEPGVERVDAVDVLGRVDRVDDRAQADRRRERHLDDDAVDGRVVVELADGGDDAGLRRFAFELDEAGVDADLGAAPQDPLEVDGGRGIAAHDDHAETRRPAAAGREARDVFGDRATDLLGERTALQESRPGHLDQASTCGAIGSRGSLRATFSRVSAAYRSTSWSS